MAFSGQNLVSDVSPREIPTIALPLGGNRTFALVVRDRTTGHPKTIPNGAVVKLTAGYQWGSDMILFSKIATITNAATGSVSVTITSEHTTLAGCYTATLSMWESDLLTHTQPLYIEIEANDLYQTNGPPTLAEIRLYLRDTAPESNYLLDETEFSDTEIAACLRRPIDMFNETLPNVTNFTMATFPYRHNWIKATIAFLYKIAAANYRRNRLQYSAGGITIDKIGTKAAEYEQLAAQWLEEYRDWVQNEKIRMNIEGGFGIVGSPYLGRVGW